MTPHFAILLGVFAVSGALILMVNRVVPEPFMDEIFHADQAQRYCAGNYTSWNQKITTPPGLYLLSVLAVKSVAWTVPADKTALLCDVRSLRLINCLILAVTVAIVAQLQIDVWKRSGSNHTGLSRKAAFIAVNVVNFPILWFSCLLFYTDLLSVTAVLLMFLSLGKGCIKLSAVFGAYSVLMRQTNIVWAACAAALLDINALQQNLAKNRYLRPSDHDNLLNLVVVCCKTATSRPRELAKFLLSSLLSAYAFLILAGAFCSFIYWNHGIALGDRSAHTVVPHLSQLFYCLSMICAFGVPLWLNRSTVTAVLNICSQMRVRLIIAICATVLSIYCFTYDHPYLLADNRHYTFYIWRRWFMRHWLCKFLLAPVYVLSAIILSSTLQRHTQLWRLLYFTAVLLVTVPNRLLEFRYFIIPYIIWRIHLSPESQGSKVLLLELVFYSAVNGFTLWLFLTKPFTWPHEPNTLQRFMW